MFFPTKQPTLLCFWSIVTSQLHQQQAREGTVRNDDELGKLLADAADGVLPNIHNVLLPKKIDKGGEKIPAASQPKA
ncbi:hypothetical protein IFM89_010577 [Coptis chinensis]|uniref:Histone H2A C-terminal domain-containing protein n=1 Tax=Coptis chinensis TaxID=261450 RepID=A0A835MDP3_9MAGN|nr:hypothetical protein IFM89_010577 [Coptis chinensis]